MKLIVGLGNPEKKYTNTRHNAGFNFIDNYAKSKNIKITKSKYQGLYTETIINNEKIILLKPQKYMNLSGEVIRKYVDFYKIPVSDILVIHDDIDTTLGKIKFRYKGSSGGHNGLKNIELHLQTQEYKRLKIGVSKNKTAETKDYVLEQIPPEEKEQLEKIYNQAEQIIDDYLTLSFEQLMSKYN